MWKCLILVISLVSAQEQIITNEIDDDPQYECGQCNKQLCPEVTSCPAGMVSDTCDCCTVCGKTEGQKCESPDLKLPYKNVYGYCGNQLECQLRNDLKEEEELEAICVCKSQQLVCATNNKTYNNFCVLNEAPEEEKAEFKEWGPCKSKPEITGVPSNKTEALGTNVALGCEAKGYPIPAIYWEFLSDDGVITTLPSDNMYIAVQARGGPERYMVSGWVQIMKANAQNSGVYTCVAHNAEGDTKASASVGFYKPE